MRNTNGDVALTNISRETKYFHNLVQYLKRVIRLSSASVYFRVLKLWAYFSPMFFIKKEVLNPRTTKLFTVTN